MTPRRLKRFVFVQRNSQDEQPMGEILIAVLILPGVTLFFGALLAIANRFLRVEEDPRVEIVTNKLPGTNCGACGQPGCEALANAIVQGTAAPGLCTVTSPEAIQDIADFMGVAAGFQEKRVARLHCAGGRSAVRRVAEYRGFSSCRAAYLAGVSDHACPWGCLGLGDCERSCTFDAIMMNSEALPVVAAEKCAACSDCVDVCPLGLFELLAFSQKLLVQCNSPLAGDAAREACAVVCDACGRCAVDAPEGAIVMRDGLPVILDAARAAAECTARCPTGAITWLAGDQFRNMTVPLETFHV